jgi:hypothetical protein
MNIDLDSQLPFGDGPGLRAFMLTHRFVHSQIAVYVLAQYGIQLSDFGLLNEIAVHQWEELMRQGRTSSVPQALQDWLNLHNTLHNQEFEAFSGENLVGLPDLSSVNFSSQEQFYDWMTTHQELHDYEQSVLGFT